MLGNGYLTTRPVFRCVIQMGLRPSEYVEGAANGQKTPCVIPSNVLRFSKVDPEVTEPYY